MEQKRKIQMMTQRMVGNEQRWFRMCQTLAKQYPFTHRSQPDNILYFLLFLILHLRHLCGWLRHLSEIPSCNRCLEIRICRLLLRPCTCLLNNHEECYPELHTRSLPPDPLSPEEVADPGTAPNEVSGTLDVPGPGGSYQPENF